MRRQRDGTTEVIHLDDIDTDHKKKKQTVDVVEICSSDDDVVEIHPNVAAAAAVAADDNRPQASSVNNSLSARMPIFSSLTLDLGWIVQAKVPSSLAISKFETGFNALMAARPAERGQVVMRGNMVDVPRYQKAYLRDYSFSGMTHVADTTLPPCVRELLEWANTQIEKWLPLDQAAHVLHRLNDMKVPLGTPISENESDIDAVKRMMRLKWRFSSCLINWYMNGEHYIGPHQDDESQLWPCSPILSLTLGQTRTFRIRGVGAITGAETTKRDINITNGTIVIMGGRMQENFTHEITKITAAHAFVNPRVNITFRCFRE